MPAGTTAFTKVMGRLDVPMVIVTASAGEERDGCLVGFTTQASIHPPRFLACLSVRNRTYAVARRATHLAVHLVPAPRRDLAELFGGETGDEVDKLARCDWFEGPNGEPLLRDCPDRFCGRIEQRLDFGDHVGFLLVPEAGEHGDGGEDVLGFRDVRDIDPGHGP